MLIDRIDLLDHLVELARILVRISEDLEQLQGVTFSAEQRMLGNTILVQLDECLAGARQFLGD